MTHEYYIIEIILWTIAMTLLGVASVNFYKKSRKEKSWYLFGVAGFTLSYLISRIYAFIYVYFYGYSYSPTLLSDPGALMFQIGYNMFSYVGLFALYFGLERFVIKKTKYVFSIATAVLTVIATINHFVFIELIYFQIPFFLLVIWGIPGMYMYIAMRSSGDLRRTSLIICAGMVIFELGIVLGVPFIQYVLSTSLPFPWLIEFLGPILHAIGITVIAFGFSQRRE